jgi:hypothetical protein
VESDSRLRETLAGRKEKKPEQSGYEETILFTVNFGTVFLVLRIFGHSPALISLRSSFRAHRIWEPVGSHFLT